jgi:glycosyltransferase involved in cell wall biosynthesis
MRSEGTVPDGVLAVDERVILSTPPNGPRFAEIVRSPSETPTILIVGRVEPQKGVEVAYRALATLRERYNLDASLLVVGAGSAGYVRKLDRLADELGVASHIKHLGFLDFDDLARAMATTHVQIVPSTWPEPLGMVCIEAALARIPVVASNIGGIPECLSHGKEALLVDPGDVGGLADAIAKTLLDREETRLRTIRAHIRAEELSLARYLEESGRFVEEVVESAARRRRTDQPQHGSGDGAR